MLNLKHEKVAKSTSFYLRLFIEIKNKALHILLKANSHTKEVMKTVKKSGGKLHNDIR